MSRIILTTIGSLEDLHPKIAIAIELRKRGHDVVFATHQEYQHKIEALGFEFQYPQLLSEVGDMSERRKSLGILHPFEFFLESFHLLPHVADIFG